MILSGGSSSSERSRRAYRDPKSKDDEEEGSPSQDGAILPSSLAPLPLGERKSPKGDGVRVEKIERSAEALRVRHHPTTFPSEKNFASTPYQK